MSCSFNRQNGITITEAFPKILDKSNHTPNKIWIDKGGEFYNRSMKSWLIDNDTKLYSTYNEGKYVAPEKFIRILKYTFYKYTNIRL